jgi:DNA-binding transcriptional LysR family regulator
MEFRQLQTFVAVVEHGTLIAAARALGYSQATVTLHIQELERELGAPLFDRVGKSVVITEVGRRVHRRAQQMLHAVDDMRRDVRASRAGERGLVRLAAIEPTASVRLPALIRKLCAMRPELDVRLSIAGGSGVADRVAGGDADLGIATPPPAASELAFEPLFDEPLVAVATRARARRLPLVLRWRDLDGERILLTEHGCAYRRTIDEAFSQRGFRLRIGLEIGSTLGLLECVRQGVGVAIAPASAVQANDKLLVRRPIADVPLSIPVGFVTRPRIGEEGVLGRAVKEALRDGLTRALPRRVSA